MSGKDYDVEFGAYQEDAARVACVKQTGACCWIFLGLMLFVVIVSYIPVSGVTEAPAYARTFLYMSLGCVCHELIIMRKSILTSTLCLAGTISTTYRRYSTTSVHPLHRFRLHV